jgi:hypothetical protein
MKSQSQVGFAADGHDRLLQNRPISGTYERSNGIGEEGRRRAKKAKKAKKARRAKKSRFQREHRRPSLEPAARQFRKNNKTAVRSSFALKIINSPRIPTQISSPSKKDVKGAQRPDGRL